MPSTCAVTIMVLNSKQPRPNYVFSWPESLPCLSWYSSGNPSEPLISLCPSPSMLAHCCLHKDRKIKDGAERRAMRRCESLRRSSWGHGDSWGQPKTLDHQPCKVYYSLTPGCLESQQLPIEHTSPMWLQLLQSLLGTCIMTMTPDPKVQLNDVFI